MRRRHQGFLIELATVGALAGAFWAEKHIGIPAKFIIVPALAVLVPLYFWTYLRPYRPRKQWKSSPRHWNASPRHQNAPNRRWKAHSRNWNPPKHQTAASWPIYTAAGLLAVTTFCVVFFWPIGSSSQASSLTSANRMTCDVRSITDGDTLRCKDGTRIRLHAVAARESDETCSVGHPCPPASGASATTKLTELAAGQTLQCEQTGTSYNRVTAVCWNEANTEINCAMVKSGTTVIWPKFNEQRPICK